MKCKIRSLTPSSVYMRTYMYVSSLCEGKTVRKQKEKEGERKEKKKTAKRINKHTFHYFFLLHLNIHMHTHTHTTHNPVALGSLGNAKRVTKYIQVYNEQQITSVKEYQNQGAILHLTHSSTCNNRQTSLVVVVVVVLFLSFFFFLSLTHSLFPHKKYTGSYNNKSLNPSTSPMSHSYFFFVFFFFLTLGICFLFI